MSSWIFDPVHSEIAFSVRHMMFAKVRGHFTRWTGTVALDETGRPTTVHAEIEVASLDTREPERDAHLRTADFLDVAHHPHLTFHSTGVHGSIGTDFKIDGDLTIRGVTRPVTLDTESTGTGKDPWGNTRRGYRATVKVNRHDFGLDWNKVLELGGVLVGHQVDVELEIQVVHKAG